MRYGLAMLVLIVTACESEDPQPMTITQTSQQRYFVADAGDDFGVLTGEVVNLEASFSRNQLNNSFNWKFLSAPESSQARLSDPDMPNTTFTADKQGIYKLELSMSQGNFTVQDTVNVSAFTISKQVGTYENLSAGSNGVISMLEMYGEMLYAAGDFTTIGGVPANGFAVFDGIRWAPAGLKEGRISNLIVYRDELYVTGIFQEIGGTKAVNIARWDGSSWHALDEFGPSNVFATMGVFEDVLYLGGALQVPKLITWNGSRFSEVTIPDGTYVSQITVFQDLLYIRTSNEICEPLVGFENWWDCAFDVRYFSYNGARWEEMVLQHQTACTHIALDHFQYEVSYPFLGNSEGAYMAGHLNKLYFKCGFWEQQQFQEFTYPLEKVFTLQTINNELYVGGLYQQAGARDNGIIKWNGNQWETLGEGIDGRVNAIQHYQGKIFIGGKFDRAGGLPVRNLAVWEER